MATVIVNNSGSTQVTVITGEGSTTYSVSTGARGPAGPSGAGGGGTVTSVATGTGLTGGPVTTTGTIALANTAVTAGVYQAPFVQVDAQGRLTKALDEPCDDEIHFSGGVFLNGSFLTATGVVEWTTPVVSAVARTGIFSGIATATNIVLYESFDFDETVVHVDFLSVAGGGFTHRFNLTKSELISRSASEIIVRWTGFVSYSTGTILPTRPAICILRIASNLAFTLTLKVQKEFLYTGTSPVVVTGRAISLAATTSAGTYTNANITVDSTGRVTTAANGSGGTAVTGTAPIDVTSGVVSLSTTLPSAYEFTSTTRPTSAATTGTLAAANVQSLITKGDADTRYLSSANAFTATDTINVSANALYIVPTLSGQRIFMGSASKAAYSVNFGNVSFIESFPSSLTMLGGTENGLSRSVIIATGDLILDTGGGTGNNWISSRNAPTSTRRSMAFIFRGLDTDSFKRVAGFIYSAVATAATWTLPHTRWSCNNDATTLMELSMAGGLNIVSAITASNFKRGTGSPESTILGSVGDIYTRTDGGTGTTLYVKESGTATNTGWVAK
jgi:hypothetical protein